MPQPSHGVRKGLASSTLLAACLLTTAGAANAELDRRQVARLGRSVLRIEAMNSSGRVQIGSGVIVAGDRVVTNCHVTREATRVWVVQAGTRSNAEAQASDMTHDVCLLRVPGLQAAAVAVGRSGSLKQGQELLALGYTGGAGLQVSSGSVVALHRWSGAHVIQCSNGFTSGASGGGLFDKDGALVGILTFRLRSGRAHYYAAPADWLLDPPQGELQFVDVRPQSGHTFWEEAPDAQPLFLQAAALESAGQWAALARLAEHWASEDAEDPESFYLRAVAYEGMGRTDDAIAAWMRSLDIDPEYSRSWAGLARLYHRVGRLVDVQHAISALMAHDPGLALEVSAELKASGPEPHEEPNR